ncbi:putative lipoprotein [Crenothrix sp.]|uniref:putative lipoprotein n=1 Tax=Crenothrix sp. TaxID=3100433 RepID=UPI00374D812C
MIILGKLQTACMATLSISVMLTLNGCSISNSIGSTSDSSGSLANSSESISDSSKSSSKSSENDDKPKKDNRYESEVSDFTLTYLRVNSYPGSRNSFMKGISDVAAHNGIVDWEANPDTYLAIGKGLKAANISGAQYETYKMQFSSGDAGKMSNIQYGYAH